MGDCLLVSLNFFPFSNASVKAFPRLSDKYDPVRNTLALVLAHSPHFSLCLATASYCSFLLITISTGQLEWAMSVPLKNTPIFTWEWIAPIVLGLGFTPVGTSTCAPLAVCGGR